MIEHLTSILDFLNKKKHIVKYFCLKNYHPWVVESNDQNRNFQNYLDQHQFGGILILIRYLFLI